MIRSSKSRDRNGDPPEDHRGDSRPVPDPTSLTTQQLNLAIGGLREVLEAQISGNRELYESRFDGMDKAITLLQVIFDRLPGEIDRKVGHLRALHEEKFDSIQTQFKERDERVKQTALDTKTAVDAALQAAKEAVGKQNEASSLSIAKSETATNKQIDQLGLLINQNRAGVNDKIDDIKQRLTRIEGQDLGKQTAQTTQQTSNTSLVGIIGLVVGTLVGIAGIVMAILQKSGG